MKTIAVVIRDEIQQQEGLRTAVGLLLANFHVQMFVLNHEIPIPDSAFLDNMAIIDQMNGERFSDNAANISQYGFKHASLEEMAAKLGKADLIIPF